MIMSLLKQYGLRLISTYSRTHSRLSSVLAVSNRTHCQFSYDNSHCHPTGSQKLCRTAVNILRTRLASTAVTACYKDITSVRSCSTESRKENVAHNKYVLLRGLPFHVKRQEIIDFLHDVSVVGGEDGISFNIFRNGSPSGEAFVHLSSVDDVTKALLHDKGYIGSRYIDVVKADRKYLQRVRNRLGDSNGNVLFMRDLPLGCSEKDILQFFAGYEVVPNGITQPPGEFGGPSVTAYVQFSTQRETERAFMERDMKAIVPSRYVRLGRSTANKARESVAASDSSAELDSDKADNTISAGVQNSVYMRGAPFSVTETEVVDFLAPLTPRKIIIGRNDRGKTGNVIVSFDTEGEACEALKKHKSHMGHRYVEVSLYERSSGQRGKARGESFPTNDFGRSSTPQSVVSSRGYDGETGDDTSMDGGMGHREDRRREEEDR